MSTYKSRKPQLKQRDILNFFSPASASRAAPAKTEKTVVSTTTANNNNNKTPEKIAKAVARQSRFAQKEHSRSSFEELPSSDTSFISPEITNFRNPLLQSFAGKATGSPTKTSSSNNLFVLSDDEETEKENKRPVLQSTTAKPVLKRAASSNPLDFLTDRSKKPRKRTSTPQPTDTLPTAKGTLNLSDEQLKIIEVVVHKGASLFFTGSAGTGKSVVLRSLVKELIKKHGSYRVGVTASTGLAACSIGGQTVHKYLSIGLGLGSPGELANKLKKNASATKKWKTLKVLLIDEISMIDGRLFTKIDEIAKIMKGNNQPFGGIQVVCCGDFFQLPPVDKEGKAQYCFDSKSWKSVMKHTIVLKKVFRQEGDNELIDMLNSLREGDFTERSLQMFHQLKRKVVYDDGIEPTELFPRREDVQRANERRLQALSGDCFTFHAQDSDNSPMSQKTLENLMCEKKLVLKVGAQVMYLKNHAESSIVNGSIGKVVGFLPQGLFAGFFAAFLPMDFVDSTNEFLSMVEILHNAIGGTTLSESYRAIFESLPDKWRLALAPLILEAFGSSKEHGLMPIVNFQTNDGTTMILVKQEEFTVEQRQAFVPGTANPKSLTREQLPLLLSWAMSIHKSQGQSIDRLRVDLRRVFEKGQVYVALSRATNKEHLEVNNFDHTKISVSEEVRQFYRSLKAAGE